MRPASVCLCPSEPPLRVRTKIVLLMHPKEARHERSGTGRMVRLHVDEVEILVGADFEGHQRVRQLTGDPGLYPVLLYPGPDSLDLDAPGAGETLARAAAGRRIVAFLVDATWACSRTVMRLNPWLRALPRLRFDPKEASKWVIKRQPKPECLSTIETVHELLRALDAAGLEDYRDRTRLPEAFAAMQRIQTEKTDFQGQPRWRRAAERLADRGGRHDGDSGRDLDGNSANDLDGDSANDLDGDSGAAL